LIDLDPYDVVYVDNDPVVTVHNRAIRAAAEGVVAIEGDIRRPAETLGDPLLLSVIDFGRPVGILFVDVLHFVTDEEDPAGIVAAFRDHVAAGSHLVITAASVDGVDPDRVEKVSAVYQNATTPLVPRPGSQIRTYFDGFDLVAPGVVNLTRWRADGPDIAGGLGGVGVKR
jgi:S-adenosyl methyltransferase